MTHSAMKVVGGSYREICREPSRDEFYGSALRAAMAISRAADSLEVITIATPEEKSVIQTLANGVGFAVSTEQRAAQVIFTYSTPLSAPTLSLKDPPSTQSIYFLKDRSGEVWCGPCP